MKTNITIPLGTIIHFSLNSCRDIFEKDISNEVVTLESPSDQFTTENSNVTFEWKEVKKADEYLIEIVSPRFDTTQTYFMDSVTESTSLTLALNPGKYQWRVKANNHSYQTAYSSIYSFEIDSSYNLNNQTLLLSYPATGTYYNDDAITFGWQQLYSADQYHVMLKSGSVWTTGTTQAEDYSTGGSWTNSTTLAEGTYVWSVSAINSLPSSTPYATSRVFYIDLTSPPQDVLVSPISTTTSLYADSTASFNWTRPTDLGTVQSPVYDSIYIYTDTLIVPIYRYFSSLEDATLTLPPSGTYFWRVQSFDEAGNEGPESYAKQFTVQ